MLSLSALLLLFQSIPVCLFGIATLANPDITGLGELPLPVIHTFGIVVLSMGIAYVGAIFQNRKARHWFLLGSVPTRLLGAYLFLGDGRTGTAAWDGVNAIVNLVVVLWERRS